MSAFCESSTTELEDFTQQKTRKRIKKKHFDDSTDIENKNIPPKTAGKLTKRKISGT